MLRAWRFGLYAAIPLAERLARDATYGSHVPREHQMMRPTAGGIPKPNQK